MEKIKQTATNDKAKEDEGTKASSDKASTDMQVAVDEPAEDETKVVENAKENIDEKTSDEQDTKEAPTTEQPTSKASAELSEEDELERVIREMEEADARREKEEEERRVKRAAETAAKKKAEEESRVANAAENDRKLREQEREMEKLEEEKERKRAAAQGAATESAADLLRKTSNLSLNDKQSATASAKPGPSGRAPKPQALNLAPLNTKTVEPPQPSAALQSLKTARLLDVIKADIYPPGINSPNPALNAAVTKKGTSFKYDAAFLLQFKTVFTEQPSVDFHQQIKTLIGDNDGGRSASNRSGGGSGRQSTRGSTSSFPMGSFGGRLALNMLVGEPWYLEIDSLRSSQLRRLKIDFQMRPWLNSTLVKCNWDVIYLIDTSLACRRIL
ncbi:hypothetical protein NUW58_g2528 [Xylaria curta]|uniref:Uncharacterized protein n=1 Tax=Xylaria curta TaxID=42375 RepID=A0ACC1PIC7_9PEZI|nr:hypothetical protein NUW58_g2528 [Xylaria curta]